ncbi:MAG: helix-turn-helix transcriptional regulator [Desulfobacterales bacterium]|nr:helix-turn-helix transcriptional regulator [Desulfobacterales bacterium]
MKKTEDALEILKRRRVRDLELQNLYEEEKVNFQAALAIREAREAAGVTQEDLANLIGTTQSVISRLENANYEGHTLKILERIANELKHRLIIHLEPIDEKRASFQG